MPSVALGVEERRVKCGDGSYRVFYYVKSSRGILVLHVFEKKTQKTPRHEIELVVNVSWRCCMKKSKMLAAKNATALAKLLGLSPAHAAAWELKIDLNDKIIQIVKRRGLTHAQVAKMAKTSRTRITALLNHNSVDISTDLMLRILGALGYSAKITIQKAA